MVDSSIVIPPNIGEMFVGIGVMALMFVGAYFVYQIARFVKPLADKEERYELFEDLVLTDLAKTKGHDLDKELEKRNIKKKRSFRKEVEKEVLETMFGKEDKDDRKGK